MECHYPSLYMKQIYKFIKWQDASTSSPTINGIMPAFDVIVSTNRLHKNAPQSWRTITTKDPSVFNISYEAFQFQRVCLRFKSVKDSRYGLERAISFLVYVRTSLSSVYAFCNPSSCTFLHKD